MVVVVVAAAPPLLELVEADDELLPDDDELLPQAASRPPTTVKPVPSSKPRRSRTRRLKRAIACGDPVFGETSGDMRNPPLVFDIAAPGMHFRP